MKNTLTALLLVFSFAGFAQSSDATLTTQANVIRNETATAGNTKVRIANMFQAIIDSKPSLLGSYSNPSWITSIAWGKIASTPTTLAGYGIVDAPTTTYVNNADATLVPKTRTITINAETHDLTTNPTFTVVGSGGTWGSITGTLSSQTDLTIAINAKVADALTNGVTTIAPSQNAVYDALTVTTRVAVTGTATLTSADFGKWISLSGTSANYTVTLPTAVGHHGEMMIIKADPDVAVLNKVVTIDGAGTEKIDGYLTRTLARAGYASLIAREVTGVGSWEVVAFDQGSHRCNH